MKKRALYRICLIACLCMIRSLQGWGSDSTSLPRLSFEMVSMDTIPAVKTSPTQTEPTTEGPIDKVIKPVVKQVPKSKKQLKPVAIPGNLPVKPLKTVKPKVIIRKIGAVGL